MVLTITSLVRKQEVISQYDFNVSFNIEDRVYLGATLGVYDVNYDRYTSYTENLMMITVRIMGGIHWIIIIGWKGLVWI